MPQSEGRVDRSGLPVPDAGNLKKKKKKSGVEWVNSNINNNPSGKLKLSFDRTTKNISQ